MLLQNIEYRSLCLYYACWLSILYIIVCTCQSQPPSLFLSPPSLPFDNCKFVLYVCESLFVLKTSSLVSVLIQHLSNIIQYLSFAALFTSLSMIISRSIHVPANGIIAFFLWISNIPLFICINITSSSSIHLSMNTQFASINVTCYYKCPDDSVVRNPPANAGDAASVLGLGRSPLERKIVTHSSVLACEIPWTEEPGGPESIELQKSQTQLCKQNCYEHWARIFELEFLSFLDVCPGVRLLDHIW